LFFKCIGGDQDENARDDAKEKAPDLVAGKTVKRLKKKIKAVDNDDDDTNGVGQDDGENNHGKGEF